MDPHLNIPCSQDHSETVSVIEKRLGNAFLIRTYGDAWKHRCTGEDRFPRSQHDGGVLLHHHLQWHGASDAAGSHDVRGVSFVGVGYFCLCDSGCASRDDVRVRPA